MALVERHQRVDKVTGWPGQIPLNYLYTCGRAGERFLSALKTKGRILGTRCVKCGITYVPPRIYCERCFARLEGSYLEVPSRGTVHTFTICHEDYRGERKDSPSIVAMVRLDGTDGGLVHWLGGVEPGDVHIGMAVEAVFKPQRSRTGSILDISHFKPIR
jgi:uncharacterized OB-fold protein